MGDDLIDSYKPVASQWEGVVPWMYRDGRGYLTIGIGHFLAKSGDGVGVLDGAIKDLWNYDGGPRNVGASSDLSLAFITSCAARKPGPKWDTVHQFMSTVDIKSGAIHQTGNDVPGVWGIDLPEGGGATIGKFPWLVMAAEARKIMTLPFGQKDAGGFFRCYNSFELTSDAIEAIFEHDVEITIGQLQGQSWKRADEKHRSKDYKISTWPEFDDFDNFPVSAQMVIVDLAFQLGAAGVANYDGAAFRRAIGKGDWKEAYKYCPQPAEASHERNRWRKDTMKQAADEMEEDDKEDTKTPAPVKKIEKPVVAQAPAVKAAPVVKPIPAIKAK